ncbi:MAG TPA: SapC family protein [Sphingomonas sp.]|nr:SapC family protein [Sphingomonas sp.]
MARIELLSNRDRRSLRLDAAKMGNRHFVQIVAGEFAAAAAHCPIVFSKRPDDGRFYAGAVLGFKAGENLLRDEDVFAAGFCPLDVVRDGFFVVEEQVAIDRENPRFTAGEPMFDVGGEPSERLRQVQHALGTFKLGLEETDAFIDALIALKLIESIDVTLHFDDGERVNLAGIYTVSLDALHDLDDRDALALFHRGWLQLAYTMAMSLKQIAVLAARRNRKLAAAA